MEVHDEMIEEYLSWPRGVLEVEYPSIPKSIRWRGREISYDDSYDLIIAAGMGGSGVVGDSLATVCAMENCNSLVLTVKDYYLPPLPKGARVLVLAISYSGDTEETLSVTHRALMRQIPVVGITSGGRLAKIGIPVVKVPRVKAPRLGYAYMLEAALRVLEHYGVLDDRVNSKSLHQDHELVELIVSKFNAEKPLVLVPAPLTSVGHRLKSELNENSKLVVHYEVIPEAHHNLSTALEGDRPSSILIITHSKLKLHHKLRVEATSKLLEDLGLRHYILHMPNTGSTATDLVQFAMNLGIASVKLAKLRGVDPLTTRSIDLVKRFMSSKLDAILCSNCTSTS